MHILTGNDIPNDQAGIVIESSGGDDFHIAIGTIHDGMPHVLCAGPAKWEPAILASTGECLVGFIPLSDLRLDIQRQVTADWIATHRKTTNAATAA